MFVAAGRDWKHSFDRTSIVYQQKDLAIDIHLDVRVASVLRCGRSCAHYRFEIITRKSAGTFPPFPLLKQNQTAASRTVDYAINFTGWISHLREARFSLFSFAACHSERCL